MFGLTDWVRDKIEDWRWGKVPQHEIDLAEKRMREICEYKEGKGWVLKPGVKLVSAKEDCLERRKNPEYMKLYKEAAARMQRKIKAEEAHIAKRKALARWVRAVWASISRGMGDRVL